MVSNVSAGQKWAQLEKEYIHPDWTSDTKNFIIIRQGGDIFDRERNQIVFKFLTKLRTLKNRLINCPYLPSKITENILAHLKMGTKSVATLYVEPLHKHAQL